MRRITVSVIASLAGILLLVDFFVRNDTIDRVGHILVEGAMVIGACALIGGVVNLLTVHGARITRRERNWPHSLGLLLSLLVVLVLGLVGISTPSFRWVFRYVYSPLQATILSLLAFLIVTAAYRALRLNSKEAIVLLLVSGFLLVAQIPGVSSLWAYIPAIREWLLSVPVTGGMRGLILGVALGSVTTALRVLLWADRPYLN